MSNTLQLNLRIPVDLKIKAQNKAEKFGTNINFLVKMFLSKFVKEENIVVLNQDIKLEKIFDKGFREQFMSTKGKKTNQQINKKLEQIMKDKGKYLV